MGAKDSKPSFISYDDAVRRVSESELRRIREAFKRCSTGNGTALSFDTFVHEVLCDGVPTEVAEWLYQVCGGTKRGISFKDLLCGIVVLTKGSKDEKIKFLWTLYTNNQSENGGYIYKWDFARTLHVENSSLPVTCALKTSEILTGLFGVCDKATYEQFRSWLLIHRDATVLSKWLFTDRSYSNLQDLETPTFYQSLAGVTHLEEKDIIELEKCFWSLRNSAATGQLDLESVSPLLSPPLPSAAVAGTFLAFDENRDGHVDFKELCCGLSAACRGPRTERLKFCFKIFDKDRDGLLNTEELTEMVSILCQVANEAAATHSSRASTPEDNGVDGPNTTIDPTTILKHLKGKLSRMPKNKPHFILGAANENDSEDVKSISEKVNGLIGEDLALTQEDFLIWSIESADALVTPFLDLIFEICHIVLGLRPQCRHEERDIVLGWLSRAEHRGYSVGQFWYLVSGEWWSGWRVWTGGVGLGGAGVGTGVGTGVGVGASTGACCSRPTRIDCTDDSFTTNSTESMGSLMYLTDSGSVGSGSSSGVSSGGAARHPGPIDNTRLRAPDLYKVRSLTGEGGLLRRDVTLAQHRDFELIPDQLWRALALWYSAPDPLPRQVIRPPNSDVELELYPLQLKILRHVPTPQNRVPVPVPMVVSGVYGGVTTTMPSPPERRLAYTAAFSRLATVKQVCEFLSLSLRVSREDMRLWSVGSEGTSPSPSPPVLLEERRSLQQLGLITGDALLLELRNADLTWPEEIGALSLCTRGGTTTSETGRPALGGASGLHNLGNTCYMNAALQAVWNTSALTRYFNSGLHLYELNTRNPLGTGGVLALRYGQLCKEVWSVRARSVAPWRVRVAVSRHARALSGGGQHDAQELLAWLLDTLHEDLSRTGGSGTGTTSSSSSSSSSIITQLFHGELKSRVRCASCSHDSVRFDAFNMLSLPLPVDTSLALIVKVVLQDGSVPVKYGVKVNSEGTFLDLKKNLSELCGLPPQDMVVVELAGPLVGAVLDDAARVTARDNLVVYEVPATKTEWETSAETECAMERESAMESESAVGVGVGVVVGGQERGEESPGFYDHRPTLERTLADGDQYRSNTLPKNLRRVENSSPTLSVRSLNLKPSTPRLGKVKFGSSPSNMHRMDCRVERPFEKVNYLIAVHRKQSRVSSYFLPCGRAPGVVFGSPLLVPLAAARSGRELYAAVWTQLARLLSRRPAQAANHAADCDDSLGYTFPFALRVVDGRGWWCGVCPWSTQCRGCVLSSGGEPGLTVTRGGPEHDIGTTPSAQRRPTTNSDTSILDTDSPIAKAKLYRQYSNSVDSNGCTVPLDLEAVRSSRRGLMLAIDWDPTALHLRYQTTREKACTEHRSATAATAAARRGRHVRLRHCLRAFCREERLDEPYHCSNCRAARPATNTLQLYRLPPQLIIHLKRFQYVNNKWIKSQKVVDFPFEDFDPTAYLASVPQETILRHKDLKSQGTPGADNISDSDSDSSDDEFLGDDRSDNSKSRVDKKDSETVRKRLESTSLDASPVMDDNLIDYHQHRLLKGQDPLDLKYRLYAVVSHTGQLSGGHYVAYCRHRSGAWLCYNDSMCRELPTRPSIDPAAAYLLFYERQGLDNDAYLPDVTGKEPVISDAEALDPDESELKKMCTIM